MNNFMESLWEYWPIKSKMFRLKSSRLKCDSSYSQPLIQYLGPWESKMVTLQSIIIWEKPEKSVLALITSNLIFWYFAMSGVKFFYGVSLVGLAAFLHHQWVYSIWPEISVPNQDDQEEWTPVHPGVLSVPEVSRYIEQTWNYINEKQRWIWQLRKRRPGMFCIVVTFVFSILWIIGYYVSGTNLLYGTMMAVMCGPGFFIHVVPKMVYSQIKNFYLLLFGKEKMSYSCEIKEFLPEETCEEVQSALGIPLNPDETPHVQQRKPRKTRVKAKQVNKKEKTTNSSGSFVSGLSGEDFPSLDDNLDSLEDSEFALPQCVPGKPESMSFVSTHFGDSDDEDFAQGLSFRKITSPDQSVLQSESCIYRYTPVSTDSADSSAYPSLDVMSTVASQYTPTILTSLSQQLMSAMTTNVPESSQQPKRMSVSVASSSIDEEFEMISDDDLH